MIGYACSNLTLQEKENITPARTCRLSTLEKSTNPIKHCTDIARKNLEDTLKILKWNQDNNIEMYRLSASMFPFATHKDYGWLLDNIIDEIKEVGNFVRDNLFRISVHLPQFINLGTPRPEVLEKSFKDLIYYTDFIDRLDSNLSHKIIIHGGGVYEDRNETLYKIIESYNKLPDNVKARLVIENDDKNWTVNQLYPIHEETGATLLFDHLHWHNNHEENSNFNDDLGKVLATWKEKPKIHYSEQDPTRNLGAHSFLVDNVVESDRFDTMVEAKGKELAILPFIKGEKSSKIIK